MLTAPNEVERAIGDLNDVELAVWRAIEKHTPTFRDMTDANVIVEDMKDEYPGELVKAVLFGLWKKDLLLIEEGAVSPHLGHFQTVRAALRMPQQRVFIIEGHLLVEKVVKKEIDAGDIHEAMKQAEALFGPDSFEPAKEKTFNIAKASSKEDETIGFQKQWSPE